MGSRGCSQIEQTSGMGSSGCSQIEQMTGMGSSGCSKIEQTSGMGSSGCSLQWNQTQEAVNLPTWAGIVARPNMFYIFS